jgi:phosphoglycolate phosphatase
MDRKKEKASVLITDLDNTLYDWFAVWYQSFRAMLTSLVEDSGIPEETLIREIKEIHQRHGTSEYLRLISEIPSLKLKHTNENTSVIYANAISKYAESRDKTLSLFPSVLETLKAIKNQGTLIVGYTESQAFYSEFRIKYLKLDGIFDFLYSPEGHEIPESDGDEQYFFPLGDSGLKHTKHHHTPHGEIKPNSDILLSIINDLGASSEDAIYIGDSLTKDIAMAKSASVRDVLAQYGVAPDNKEYELLRDVTHWTEAAVETEKNTTQKEVAPSISLRNSFSELLDYFDFVPFKKDNAGPM